MEDYKFDIDKDLSKFQDETDGLNDIDEVLEVLSGPFGKYIFEILVHSFEDATETEAYSYSGADYEAGLINWFPQKVFIFDVNNDGEDDVILPMAKGYAQKGINSATPFIALTVENGKLIILGDWLSFFTYGYFDGNELSLLKWKEDAAS